MSIIGYARVSTVGQSLEVQNKKLNCFGCSKIFAEKLSGIDVARPELKNCLDYLRDGDVLVITKLDRLARSTLHLHEIIQLLNKKAVRFKVIDQAIDTTTKEGRLMFSILACIAEFETELRKERQLDGIARAKANGVAFGRKAKLSDKEVKEMKLERSRGVLIKDLMKKYNLSKASVYRLLGNDKKNGNNYEYAR